MSPQRLALSIALGVSVWCGPTLGTAAELTVPIVRQAPERCGQAALEMVLRYYGAEGAALHEGDQAYDPVLRGSLITDLAAAARRAGFAAVVGTRNADSLVSSLASGVPPIVLYQSGRPPLTRPHFGVVTGWDAVRGTFTILDGRDSPRVMSLRELGRRWRPAGSQALMVSRRTP